MEVKIAITQTIKKPTHVRVEMVTPASIIVPQGTVRVICAKNAFSGWLRGLTECLS